MKSLIQPNILIKHESMHGFAAGNIPLTVNLIVIYHLKLYLSVQQ